MTPLSSVTVVDNLTVEPPLWSKVSLTQNQLLPKEICMKRMCRCIWYVIIKISGRGG